MTVQPPLILRLDCGQVPLAEDDYEYVLGAYLERKAAATSEGRDYHVTDFIRDALIEASHR